jgi:hypothetical protein
MKKTEIRYDLIEKKEKFYNVLSADDMLKIRGGDQGVDDPGHFK